MKKKRETSYFKKKLWNFETATKKISKKTRKKFKKRDKFHKKIF